jgi:hypothetical protein
MTKLRDIVPERRYRARTLDIHPLGAHAPTMVERARGAWRITCKCGAESGRIADDHDACVWWYAHASEGGIHA